MSHYIGACGGTILGSHVDNHLEEVVHMGESFIAVYHGGIAQGQTIVRADHHEAALRQLFGNLGLQLVVALANHKPAAEQRHYACRVGPRLCRVPHVEIERRVALDEGEGLFLLCIAK